MITKLTLSINSEIIEKAKKFFQTRDQSLSSLVEDYFRLLIKTKQRQEITTPIVRELSGIAKGANKNDKEIIYEYLEKKYK